MKHFFTLASLAVIFSAANATVVTVTCQNTPSHFLPVTANAVVGDSIHWVWVAGTHVVGPESASDIPVGAAMWNCPIDASHLSCYYVVTVAGNYHYVCHPATPHGEDAYIVVSPASGVQPYNTVSNVSSAYPNPFSEKITIETSTADLIIIYNFMGEKVKSFAMKSGQVKVEADVAALPAGIFFYSISKDGAILETRKIIKGW
ncbi:MAG: T9SS type A sorting domain-containing protein [Bacteroidetes bacterium]|nr:T9SS type A sorting domain-containing protein [Bacteroidota bacterium]